MESLWSTSPPGRPAAGPHTHSPLSPALLFPAGRAADAAGKGADLHEVEMYEEGGSLVIKTPGGTGGFVVDGIHVGDGIAALNKAATTCCASCETKVQELQRKVTSLEQVCPAVWRTRPASATRARWSRDCAARRDSTPQRLGQCGAQAWRCGKSRGPCLMWRGLG